MANDIIDCCPHCGRPRSATDSLSLINDHNFISDLARFAEGIISQHGGTISAFNRLERGACLEVLLPSVSGQGGTYALQ